MTIQVDLIAPDALSAADRGAWAAFREAEPAFASPLGGAFVRSQADGAETDSVQLKADAAAYLEDHIIAAGAPLGGRLQGLATAIGGAGRRMPLELAAL